MFSAQILTFIKSAFRKGGERKTRIYFLFRLMRLTVHRKLKLQAVQMIILPLWDWPQILRLYLLLPTQHAKVSEGNTPLTEH